jgi:hypothetical protein
MGPCVLSELLFESWRKWGEQGPYRFDRTTFEGSAGMYSDFHGNWLWGVGDADTNSGG